MQSSKKVKCVSVLFCLWIFSRRYYNHIISASLHFPQFLCLLHNQATPIHEEGDILYKISHHGCVPLPPPRPHQPPVQAISGGFLVFIAIMESLSCAAWLRRWEFIFRLQRTIDFFLRFFPSFLKTLFHYYILLYGTGHRLLDRTSWM